MVILSGKYEVTPENLFTLSKRLLGIDAEKHWLTENELRLEHTRDDLFRVWFYGNVIGHVTAQPLNPNISLVGVWIDPTQDNPDNKKIIQKLADSIDYNVPKVIPQDSSTKDYSQEAEMKPTTAKQRRIAPKRSGHYNNWIAVWKVIKPWIDKYGMQPDKIEEELKKRPNNYKGPVFGRETLSKIIEAGKAGELETS